MQEIFQFTENFERKLDEDHILNELQSKHQIDASHTSIKTLN